MRVTNTAAYRNFTTSINDVQVRLNKSLNKVSTGKAYEAAADNPLAYYEGKKIDNQYQNTLTRLSLVTDVKNRLYQQELGAREIQDLLSKAKGKIEYLRSDSNNGTNQSINTGKDDLLQKQQAMVNSLNAQYQNFYIFGGNDLSRAPFSLSADGTTLTFTHTFAGDDAPTEMVMELKEIPQGSGAYQYEFSGKDNAGQDMDTDRTLDCILKAMREQGRMDVGYGTISKRDTLLDTYTGGLNLLTGLSSDTLNALPDDKAIEQIKDRLNNSPVGLIGTAVSAIDNYLDGGDKSAFSSVLGTVMDAMTVTEHAVSTIYSDLGNKYALLENIDNKLSLDKVSLAEQYKDKLGADPYEAITEMFAFQQSYNAALRVGSNIMSSSLFDFMR